MGLGEPSSRLTSRVMANFLQKCNRYIEAAGNTVEYFCSCIFYPVI